MPSPLAYFLTWTTHGTWLHGDELDSVDRHHNRPGAPRIAPDTGRALASAARMPLHAYTLSPAARQLVDAIIRQHCGIRSWPLLALNVRTNHVHVVVSCPAAITPENALSQLKAWSTRRLREHGHLAADARAWTEHGSTRWINNHAGLDAAIGYVTNGQ